MYNTCIFGYFLVKISLYACKGNGTPRPSKPGKAPMSSNICMILGALTFHLIMFGFGLEIMSWHLSTQKGNLELMGFQRILSESGLGKWLMEDQKRDFPPSDGGEKRHPSRLSPLASVIPNNYSFFSSIPAGILENFYKCRFWRINTNQSNQKL